MCVTIVSMYSLMFLNESFLIAKALTRISNKILYLFEMPLVFTDRWIQLVEGHDFHTEVFTDVSAGEMSTSIDQSINKHSNVSTHLLEFSSALLRLDEFAWCIAFRFFVIAL